ncbi:transporter substrate-binding domain-containing protein [Microbispora sp. RL4-1S]|uniref:Transporter substrate-binding domain-containing protein n=1 Tax=Microbispora oryzae TaxID=2806554 RepID=A0A941AHI0_9ACTN|nr:transporter substrate-binding domain-containing protein [Microbispora oryzae]MBP2702732.1 transporter substrate-binding domain-containing protein [Microbispora oryzae]
MWRVVAVVSCLAAAFLTTSCGDDGGLVIAVQPGRPGLVTRLPDGSFAGFDIAVAQYVARDLGYRDDQLHYTLDPAGADLVLGAPIGRAPGPVAGPYLVTSTEVLVRAGDLSITRIRDLARKRVCGTAGSSRRLVARFGDTWKKLFLAQANVPAACAPLLTDGRTDAIVAEAPVLAGLEAQYPGRFRFSGRPLESDRYGIRTASPGLRDQVNEALRHMFDDGTWKRAVIDHLGVLATRYASPPALDGAAARDPA